MQESRARSAAAYHPAHGWVITGGLPGPKSTSERTWDGCSFSNYQEMQLPIPLHSHSIVALDDGGEAQFFLTGGWTGRNYSNRSFLFKKG